MGKRRGIRGGLTDHEGALISAATYFCARTVADADRGAVMLAIMAEAAPECDCSHLFIGPVVNAAERLTQAVPRSQEWTWARADLGDALANLSEWRAGLFWEQVRAKGIAHVNQ